MRYNILLNQVKVREWDLNLSEAVLFSFIYELPSWADHKEAINGPWYFCAKTKILEEIPLLTTKKDTVYRLLKSLEEKGLIRVAFQDGKDWIQMTRKASSYNSWEVGKISEGVGNISVSGSEKNPLDNTTIENNRIKDPAVLLYSKKMNFINDIGKYIFEQNLKTEKELYPIPMIIAFCRYWIEPSKDGKKIRFDKESFFEKGGRLAQWHKRTDPAMLSKMWEEQKKTDMNLRDELAKLVY